MKGHLISEIYVEDLFGLYTYTLSGSDGQLPDASILYGNNGAGKTTILRMAFHLLSGEDNKGHKTALSKIPFKDFKITFRSGIIVGAKRLHPESLNILTLTIHEKKNLIAEWVCNPERTSNFLEDDLEWEVITTKSGRFVKQVTHKKPADNVLRGKKDFLNTIVSKAPTIFFLDAERRLIGDAVPDVGIDIEYRRLNREEESRSKDLLKRVREVSLTQALNAASRAIGGKAVKGANRGALSVHNVYGEILNHFVLAKKNKDSTIIDVEVLKQRLRAIEITSKQYAVFELTTPLDMSAFQQALTVKKNQQEKAQTAARVIQPYLESLESRFEALQPTYMLIAKLSDIINGLLQDKALTFKLSEGFTISNKLGLKLGAGQLSSGEQQLLLLFAYVVTNLDKDKPSVFIIDEPEISLNVMWQRSLITSLLAITHLTDAKIQFLFASHSIELLAQHSDKVIALLSQK